MGEQSLDSIPKPGSLNALMFHTGEPAFVVKLDSLYNYLPWYQAFESGMDYFFIGSAYNNQPGEYYVGFDPNMYNYLINFENSTASDLL